MKNIQNSQDKFFEYAKDVCAGKMVDAVRMLPGETSASVRLYFSDYNQIQLKYEMTQCMSHEALVDFAAEMTLRYFIERNRIAAIRNGLGV